MGEGNVSYPWNKILPLKAAWKEIPWCSLISAKRSLSCWWPGWSFAPWWPTSLSFPDSRGFCEGSEVFLGYKEACKSWQDVWRASKSQETLKQLNGLSEDSVNLKEAKITMFPGADTCCQRTDGCGPAYKMFRQKGSCQTFLKGLMSTALCYLRVTKGRAHWHLERNLVDLLFGLF